MDKTDASQLRLLSEAAVVWTGRGKNSWPVRDDSAVVNHFGAETSGKLLATLRALEKEFYSSDAWKGADLREIGEVAAREFRTKHPEIPDEIAEIFAWCYTYDYK